MSGQPAAPKPQNASDTRKAEGPPTQLVGFRLDETDYAIEITRAREIILMRPITRLPQVPDFIEGLINLRGLVIPIINLRKRFGLPDRPVDEDTRIIVVGIQDKIVGCIVDAVKQVIRISADQVRPAPVGVTAVARRHIASLARMEDRIIVILDVDTLLDTNELEDHLP